MAAPLLAEPAGDDGSDAILYCTGMIGIEGLRNTRLPWGLTPPVVTAIATWGVVAGSSVRFTCSGPWCVTPPVELVLPCGVTPAVEAGHRGAVKVVAPIPPLSVLRDREAPDPAVDGAAIGSAIAPSEEDGFGSYVLKCLVGISIETS